MAAITAVGANRSLRPYGTSRHSYDADGKRRAHGDIPKSIADLVDDPFRSLAGELRPQGGHAKHTTPFSEFLWADFLRHRLDRKRAENGWESALAEALIFAKIFSPRRRLRTTCPAGAARCRGAGKPPSIRSAPIRVTVDGSED